MIFSSAEIHDEKILIKLTQNYEVILKPAYKMPITPLRSVGAEQIGHLVRIKGIVTRVSDVKPRISIVAYVCDKCSEHSYASVSDVNEYLPFQVCTSTLCKSRRMKDRGKIVFRHSCK